MIPLCSTDETAKLIFMITVKSALECSVKYFQYANSIAY